MSIREITSYYSGLYTYISSYILAGALISFVIWYELYTSHCKKYHKDAFNIHAFDKDIYYMLGLIVMIISFVLGYTYLYEVREYPSAYKNIISVKSIVYKVYNQDEHFEPCDRAIKLALEDGIITAREYDNIISKYEKISKSLLILRSNNLDNVENNKEKLLKGL